MCVEERCDQIASLICNLGLFGIIKPVCPYRIPWPQQTQKNRRQRSKLEQPFPVRQASDPIRPINVVAVYPYQNVVALNIAKQVRQLQALIVVDICPLVDRHGFGQIAAYRIEAYIEESRHRLPFFTDCIVFTAVARALDKSLAIGASGVANRPTMMHCQISTFKVSPPTIASATATIPAIALVQLQYMLSER